MVTTETEAQRRFDIAGARLGVAEDLRWVIAGLLAVVVHLEWHVWLFTIIAYFVPVFLVPYWYDKEYEAAGDELERVTGTGKYYVPRNDADAA